MIDSLPKEVQIKSNYRVRNHGEVLTAKREVEAMLDLVKNESERIDSSFLEPACGDGNFLVAILERKLKAVVMRYKTKRADFEFYLLSALASIYGIDLLEDNVQIARDRMFKIACDCYKNSLKTKPDEQFQNIMKFILSKNILQGDSLNGIDKIIFTQWGFTNYRLNRVEYAFIDLDKENVAPIFRNEIVNDKGEKVYFPKELKIYPSVYYRKLLEVAE